MSKMKEVSQLGESVRLVMRQYGVTQRALCRKSGVNVSTMSRIVAGTVRTISADAYDRLESVLKEYRNVLWKGREGAEQAAFKLYNALLLLDEQELKEVSALLAERFGGAFIVDDEDLDAGEADCIRGLSDTLCDKAQADSYGILHQKDNAWCIVKEGGVWSVFRYANGTREIETEFSSVTVACVALISAVAPKEISGECFKKFFDSQLSAAENGT